MAWHIIIVMDYMKQQRGEVDGVIIEWFDREPSGNFEVRAALEAAIKDLDRRLAPLPIVRLSRDESASTRGNPKTGSPERPGIEGDADSEGKDC